MSNDEEKIIVYYDGACPSCVKDRDHYEKLAGKAGEDVCWLDITGKEDHLRAIGIDPKKALSELHVRDKNHQVLTEMDAYILLLSKVPLLKPIAWLIKLPLIRPLLSRLYRRQVKLRLQRSGRL